MSEPLTPCRPTSGPGAGCAIVPLGLSPAPDLVDAKNELLGEYRLE